MNEAVSIPFVTQFIGLDGDLKPNETMETAAVALLDELARWEEALRPLRASVKAAGFLEGIYGALEFGAQCMRSLVKELTLDQLAATPRVEGFQNSIATLVMRVAAAELSMAHRLTGREIPPDVRAEYRMDQAQSPLPKVEGEMAETLLAKFDRARQALRDAYEGLTDGDLDREWEAPSGTRRKFRDLVQLLPQHQGQHFGHIQYVRRMIG